MPQASREIALSSNVLLENRSSAVAKRSTKSGGESEAAMPQASREVALEQCSIERTTSSVVAAKQRADIRKSESVATNPRRRSKG